MLRRVSVLIALLVSLAVLPVAKTGAQTGAAKPPKTGFERSGGEQWTSFEEEQGFLAAVDAGSGRMSYEVVGRSLQERPLHLVTLGEPAPASRAEILDRPTILFVCSQHGNEPAGREACLQMLRDLAYTDDNALGSQLGTTSVLFVPTANPDGIEANTRGNADGVDINRDHMGLETPEAQAIARVVRDYKPDVILDLHEYGPSVPVLYDDEILYLWPRNLNVDPQVHSLAKTLAADYIGEGVERAGYSSDEYGLYAAGDQDVAQTAGDGDEGIARNAFGLRHAIGVLIESAVTQDPKNGPGEILSQSETNSRRVASQVQASLEALRFMREQGDLVKLATDRAPLRKAREGEQRSAPVYFGGADNEEPPEDQVVDPPPCGYRLGAKQLAQVRDALALHEIDVEARGRRAYVALGQAAEPVIPLLLDERGQRHVVAGRPDNRC
ncbi:MAG: M14 family metallopeptidase [Actinomycetota bacterium]